MQFKSIFSRIFVLFIATFMMLSMTSPANASVIRDPNPNLSGGETNAIVFAANVIGAMMWIGYAIAVGMIVFIGIKYIIASADEKASMKGMLVKVFIGSFIIVFAVTITNFIISTFSVGS